MKLTELFPSTLLKAQDVTDAGGEMPVTIKEVSVRDFDGENGKESKPVMTFADGKQIVLNKTNANTLGDMLGGDTDAWLGKEITLIVEQVDFSGKKVPAIRIKNLDSNEAAIQAFWKKTREIGLTREEGLSQLKDAGQDFRKALKMLESPF
jgi:hypothetical protein